MDKPNIDPDTGIAYGVIQINRACIEFVNDVVMVRGRNLTFEEYLADIRATHPDADDNEIDALTEDYQSDSDVYYYDDGKGLVVQTCADGIYMWVFKSPQIALVATCSPCFPNAGDLDSGDPADVAPFRKSVRYPPEPGKVWAYTLPTDLLDPS